jgi:RNA polymerase sigma-70 factor (ECF subfamily)
LPDHFHQVLVLRGDEGLSYRALADTLEVPVGTVMSRLSRARDALRGALHHELAVQGVSSTLCDREEEADAVMA